MDQRTTREVGQRTRKMDFGNESRHYWVEGRHVGLQRNIRKVAGYQERGHNV